MALTMQLNLLVLGAKLFAKITLSAARDVSNDCDLWMAKSPIAGAGMGVFAGRSFAPEEIIERSRAVRISRATKESTQLQNYAFRNSLAMQLDKGHSNMSVLPLGAVPMMNHGDEHHVNVEVRFSVDGNFSELLALRHISPGAELLISYGTAEWFLLRQIPYEDTRPDVDHPTLSLTELFSVGSCLSILRHAIESDSILARRNLTVGETLKRPLIMLPKDHLIGGLARFSLAHELTDVLALPLAVPGRLECRSSPNIALSFDCNAVSDKCVDGSYDPQFPEAGVRLQVLRPIQKGEVLSARHDISSGTHGCFESSPFPVSSQFVCGWGNASLGSKIKQAATEGDVKAQFRMAQLFSYGLGGFPADLVSGTSWLEKAAQGGHAWAQLRMGEACMRGSGVARDFACTKRWYQVAAKSGSSTAQFRLGEMSMAVDRQEAISWFLRAASLGSPELFSNAPAMHFLALAFILGDILPKDITEGIQWLTRAADLGYTKAQRLLTLAENTGTSVVASNGFRFREPNKHKAD